MGIFSTNRLLFELRFQEISQSTFCSFTIIKSNNIIIHDVKIEIILFILYKNIDLFENKNLIEFQRICWLNSTVWNINMKFNFSYLIYSKWILT